jgi:eukaryotic-like serine/threonine-protein kinase
MLTPGSSIGRYVVQRKLAEGGMAEIFLCTMVGPGGFEKEVVLKVVKSFLASDAGFLKMFTDEARHASRLNHVNVVQLLDFGQHEGQHFIAMEYVRGGTLSELRKRCAAAGVKIPPTLAADICAKVARGLHHAHALADRGRPVGLVHRDVTPQNILLAFDGAVKLTDFGIAKANTSATAPGMLKGKYAYMAPEQARGEEVDVRTDVFALGITLWELLTGARLFEGSSDIMVLRAVQESVIAPPNRLNPEVSPALSAIVLKALSREPRGRYQTAAEFEEALSQFVVQNARALEDTRVDLFMRPLYPEEQDEQPSQPTGSIALADTAMRQGIGDETLKPTSPSRTALTGSSAPTSPTMQGLQPAGAAKTDRQPGLRQSVPRLAKQSLATPHGRAPASDEVQTDEPLAPTDNQRRGLGDETLHEKPGLATANMRPSRRIKAVEPEEIPPTEDRQALPPPVPTAPQFQPELGLPKRKWTGVIVGAAALAAVGLAGLVITSQHQEAPKQTEAPQIVEVAPPPAVPKPAQPSIPEPAPAPAPVAAAPEPTPPPSVEEKPETRPDEGYLDVYARPFASAVIDGKARGEVVGHKRFTLKPGKHTVQLKHPKRETEPTAVNVRAGARTRVDFNAND